MPAPADVSLAEPGIHVELTPAASPQSIVSDAPTLTEAIMEVETTSKKRPLPDQSEGEDPEEPASSRRRVDQSGIQTPPPEEVISAVLSSRPFFDDEPSQLLHHSLTLVLQHIGFDGASKESLEALCNAVDSCE